MIPKKGAGKKGTNEAPPPPTPSLDEEIREIWHRPLAATPINKDLPRLAGRIHVTVNENTVLSAVPTDVVEAVRAPPLADANSELSRKLMNSVEYRMSIVLRNQPDWVKALQLPPEVVNDMNSKANAAAARPAAAAVFTPASPAPAAKPKEAQRDSFPVWVTKSLSRAVVEKRRATDVWTAWDGPGFLRMRPATDGSRSMVLEVKMKAEKDPCAVGSSVSLLEMQDSSRYFALRRIGDLDSWLGFAFHTRQEAAQFKEMISAVAVPAPTPPPPAAVEPDPLSPRETEHLRVVRPITKVVLEVARALEPKETVTRFEAALKTLAEQRSGDLEAFMPDIWRAGGEDSRTARVFKAIHQNIIFVGIYHIKTALPDVMTRDVRTAEGWQIYVHILPDVIVITHARREQALANVPETEYFWYEWQLRMIFDVQLTDMRAARLRIVNLGFGDKTTPEKRAEYTKRFGGGNIILF